MKTSEEPRTVAARMKRACGVAIASVWSVSIGAGSISSSARGPPTREGRRAELPPALPWEQVLRNLSGHAGGRHNPGDIRLRTSSRLLQKLPTVVAACAATSLSSVPPAEPGQFCTTRLRASPTTRSSEQRDGVVRAFSLWVNVHFSHPLVARTQSVARMQGARSEADEGVVEPTSRRPSERNEADGPQSASAAERM